MKDKQAKTGKNQKHEKKLKTPAAPVPPAATELSEEDLKQVTGGNCATGRHYDNATLVVR